MKTNELTIPETVGKHLAELALKQPLKTLERNLLQCRQEVRDSLDSEQWRGFITDFKQAWQRYDHVVVRGIPVDCGATTILAGLVLNSNFKAYKRHQIVKHFRMSPWTKELSQTLRKGHFHTDINTADNPPKVTLIHCRTPDPTPGFGILRVAPLTDLLKELERRGADETLKFILETDVEMVDERARGSWIGSVVKQDTIRFHPETLRAAARRSNFARPEDIEQHLVAIHDSALSVSTPIELDKGDALFVSNTRALHYRGDCTVRYIEFPRKFVAREIYVLHFIDEPA